MNIEDLQNGDLIFMSDMSELSKAITDIDFNSQFSHVGIYFDGMIYHADFKKGVIKQLMAEYVEEHDKQFFVYRCTAVNVGNVKEKAEYYLGQPYNYSFYPDGDGLYCSQYISKILSVFDTVPMKFGDGKKEISDYWEKYYSDLGIKVPLNLEGTNPNQLSLSDKLVFMGQLRVNSREK